MYQISLSSQLIDIAVQQQQLLDFNSGEIGAVTTFTGLARAINPVANTSQNQAHHHSLITSIWIEHYPQMTQVSIEQIAKIAVEKFQLQTLSVVHRIGTVAIKDVIVWIGVGAVHRQASFLACQFMIDYLKNQAPFWKKEFSATGAHWVLPKSSDAEKMQEWLKNG